MTFRLTYEITHDQAAPGQAGRVIRVEMECEPASADEVREAVTAFLTAATGEREALRHDTHFDGKACDTSLPPGARIDGGDDRG